MLTMEAMMTTTEKIPQTPVDEYLFRRLREILATVPPTPSPTASSSRSRSHSRRWPYYIGQTARANLIAQAGGPRKISTYLTALVQANPLPQDWLDTRPEELRATDRDRLTTTVPILPMWTDGLDRRDGGTLCLVLDLETVKHFAAVARYWGIGAQCYVSRTEYRPMERLRSTPIHKLDSTPPHTLTTAVLRAIGVSYLTPRNALRKELT